MTALRRWLGRHAGRGHHSPRRVAARRHPAAGGVPPRGHQCEPWQLDESASGGTYCRACGAHQPVEVAG